MGEEDRLKYDNYSRGLFSVRLSVMKAKSTWMSLSLRKLRINNEVKVRKTPGKNSARFFQKRLERKFWIQRIIRDWHWESYYTLSFMKARAHIMGF